MIGFCLAAGAGSRLAPLTRAVPKPLLAPAGRPLLELACVALEKAGAERVVVNVHHGADALTAYLAGRPGVEVAHEPVLLGTGGGLAAARRAGLLGSGDDTVVVTSADHVLDPADVAMVGAALRRHGAPAAMGVGAGRWPPPFRLDGDRAVPDPDGPWTAAGVFAVRAALLDQLEQGYSELVDAVLEPCWRRGDLLGVPMRGPWADAGTLSRFLAVSAGLLRGRWPYPLPAGRLLTGDWADEAGATAAGPVFLAAGVVLEPGALLVGPVVLDAGSSVEAGAVVTRAVVGPGASVGARATVTGSVLGPGARAAAGTITTAALLPPGPAAGGIG
ncbi:MAG TPA: NDP-sugar synthase [Actinomycetes bacterium]|nr:NDP-sugar synthase [Actinomycetes bacterium]